LLSIGRVAMVRQSMNRRVVSTLVVLTTMAGAGRAEANPFGYHEHDRLYVRLSGGVASLAVARSTEREGTDSSSAYEGDSSRIGGASIFAELSIGGTPFRNVVIAGTLLGNNLPAAWLNLASGSRLVLGSPLWFAFLGPTVDFFPLKSGGFHAGAGVGWSVATAGVQQDQLFDTIGGGGVGGTLSTGYDAWVADDWSLGLIGRAVVARIRGEEQAATAVGREYDTVSSFSLAATVLFH
jgi:hypothetical protein